jgi:hypothetical protein
MFAGAIISCGLYSGENCGENKENGRSRIWFKNHLYRYLTGSSLNM